MAGEQLDDRVAGWSCRSSLPQVSRARLDQLGDGDLDKNAKRWRYRRAHDAQRLHGQSIGSQSAVVPLRWRAHYREAEGLSIAQIAVRLGRSPATVKACVTIPPDIRQRL
jgi:hypothetical protein